MLNESRHLRENDAAAPPYFIMWRASRTVQQISVGSCFFPLVIKVVPNLNAGLSACKRTVKLDFFELGICNRWRCSCLLRLFLESKKKKRIDPLCRVNRIIDPTKEIFRSNSFFRVLLDLLTNKELPLFPFAV